MSGPYLCSATPCYGHERHGDMCGGCYDCGRDHPPGTACPPSLPPRTFRLAYGDEVLTQEVDSAALVAALDSFPADAPIAVTRAEPRR